MLDQLERHFRQLQPPADFCSLRFFRQQDEVVSVRQDVPEPLMQSEDFGVMITVIDKGAVGYGATSDLSEDGLKLAIKEASFWARQSAGRSVVDLSKIVMPCPRGEYRGPETLPWSDVPISDKYALLTNESRRLRTDPRILDWGVKLCHWYVETLYLTSSGGRAWQRFGVTCPNAFVTAGEGARVQRRTLATERSYCRQGGMEAIDASGLHTAGDWLGREAIELLAAPNCPSGKMDLLAAPDQMVLQIHESIGHPLECDRILGDERNWAGRSFVRPDMIGGYQYGSELLNVTFDPTIAEEMTSYRYDDDGMEARKEFLIEKGILKRVLGGTISQARSGLPGVANSRACSWNRPPLDRQVNLNIEPGWSSLEEMIASVKRGVYVKSNCSWSIDDSRNKFQFGCEWGRLIENGKLTQVVRNPNYRGVSGSFWRSLKGVGNASTMQVIGTPTCGKGEPRQLVPVGHASPACLFADVDVFGGA